MAKERVIQVHFVSGHRLQLRGDHVKPFMTNYRKAVEEGAECFYSSVGVDYILIHIRQVTFVEEAYVEVENVPF